MRNLKRIILSYDYELFFGERSGTVLKSIIEPTNKLMDVMEQNGFRGNFFVDYLMFRELEKLSDERAAADLNLLKEQIRDMVRRGHRVELHLHPHWIDAKYNGDGTWNFDDFTHYSLSSLDEETIVAMFKEGTDYLNKLAAEVEPGYKIVAFRAGGWAVQPFDKLKRAFMESGIVIDSSTSLGAYSIKENQSYDFRVMPDKEVYRFSDDVCKEDANGQFLEVPITSYKQNQLFKLMCKIYFKLGLTERTTDGTHTRKVAPTDVIIKPSLFKRLTTLYYQMFSFSQFPAINLNMVLMLTKKDLICAIDHPKDFSKETEIGIRTMKHFGISCTYKELL